MWPEVGDAGMSSTGAVPLRSAQMMGQQKTKQKTARLLGIFITLSTLHSPFDKHYTHFNQNG